MIGLQIYELSKQAQFEAQHEDEIDRLWHEHLLAAPRRSVLARLGVGLRNMLGVLRVSRATPAQRETPVG